jgi:hypothetical protein
MLFVKPSHRERLILAPSEHPASSIARTGSVLDGLDANLGGSYRPSTRAAPRAQISTET